MMSCCSTQEHRAIGPVVEELEQYKAEHAADDALGAVTTFRNGNANDAPALGGSSSSQVAIKATATSAAAAAAGVEEQTQHLMGSTGSPGPKQIHWKQQQHSQPEQQLLRRSNASLHLPPAAHAGETKCRRSSTHHTPAVQFVSF
jgi:hypothetical protein